MAQPTNIQRTTFNCGDCGSPLPHGAERCFECGAPSAEAIAALRQQARDMEFIQGLFGRPNPFTFIFIGICAGIFTLMALAGGISLMNADTSVLIGFGAKVNTLINANHQYWRLITSMFIHIGLLHLAFNCYALWIVGQEIERIYGSARFVVFFMATGMAASLASYVFNPGPISAGASGSIFGLFGALVMFAFRYRSELPAALSQGIKRRIIPIIILNLLIGFNLGIVDNAAHIGGLVSGLLLGFVVPYMRPHEKATPMIWRALQIVGLAAIFISFLMAFLRYAGPRPGL